jgi:hypothetical protein
MKSRGAILLSVLFWTFLIPQFTKADAPEYEKERIQSRLKLIEELLRSRDVSFLTENQKRERLKNLERLRGYWMKGDFPKNTNHAGVRVPYFIDKHGTPCAVGYLIIASGRPDLAKKISDKDNNIYADKIDDPVFAKWADRSGLTPEELFLIQPEYGPTLQKLIFKSGTASSASKGAFAAQNLFDDNPETAWCTRKNNGLNESVTLHFRHPVALFHFSILTGYTKSER